ncbi:MAG: cell division protein FtsL, partial [Methyloversatilis sp. 12-65-5]
LAAHARISDLAETKLKMQAPARNQVIVLDSPEAAQ